MQSPTQQPDQMEKLQKQVTDLKARCFDLQESLQAQSGELQRFASDVVTTSGITLPQSPTLEMIPSLIAERIAALVAAANIEQCEQPVLSELVSTESVEVVEAECHD